MSACVLELIVGGSQRRLGWAVKPDPEILAINAWPSAKLSAQANGSSMNFLQCPAMYAKPLN
jgi:hypothetical protein